MQTALHLLSLRVALRLALLIAPLAWSQESHRRDPGVPFNYSPMKWLATNYKQQTTHFLRFPGTSPDYRIGAGDILTVDVVGEDGLRQQVQVSNNGEITFPPLGVIKATALTTTELEASIREKLVDLRLLKSPEVLVYIDEYQFKRIYVVGEVDNPGEYVMTQDLSLLDAIFMAGGIDYTADRYGYLHRRVSRDKVLTQPGYGHPGTRTKPIFNRMARSGSMESGLLLRPDVAAPGTEVFTIDLKPVKEGGVLKEDYRLQEGDVFVVPRRNVRMFYVVGEVRTPGPFELPAPAERTMSVGQAIAWAGGPSVTAKLRNGLLVRYLENGQRQETTVDFAAILAGRQSDVPIQPDDIVFIPGSNSKSFAYGLLSAVPSMVQSALLFQLIR